MYRRPLSTTNILVRPVDVTACRSDKIYSAPQQNGIRESLDGVTGSTDVPELRAGRPTQGEHQRIPRLSPMASLKNQM